MQFEGLARFSLDECEPECWFVVFHERSETWWVNWLSFGRFKHVGAVGYSRSGDFWLFFDFFTRRLRLAAVRDADFAPAWMAFAGSGSVVVRFEARQGEMARSRPRIGLTCVSAVAHLLGVSGCALRPDGLYRHLLANGGRILEPINETGNAGAGCGEAAA